MLVAVASSPPSVSSLPPCPEGSFSGTRLPTSRPILPSAASVSTTIWETRKWPPLHPTLTSGYARTQGCLPLFLPSVLLTAQPPARRPPPPRTSSCTCLSLCGLCPAAAERCWQAPTLRPALRRPLDPLSPSVPRVAGPAPEWGRGRGTKLGPRRSRVREAGAEESSSVCLCLVNCASSMVQPKAGGGRGRAASAVSSPVLVPRVAPPPSLRSGICSLGKAGVQSQSQRTLLLAEGSGRAQRVMWGFYLLQWYLQSSQNKKFETTRCQIVAERLFAQNLPQLLECDLITALGGTQNTLYVCVCPSFQNLQHLEGRAFWGCPVAVAMDSQAPGHPYLPLWDPFVSLQSASHCPFPLLPCFQPQVDLPNWWPMI